MRRLLLFIALCVFSISCGFGQAVAAGVANTKTDAGFKKRMLTKLTKGRDEIGLKVQALTQKLDNVFASQDCVELSAESRLKSGLICVIKEGGKIQVESIFNLKLSLPKTQHRLELFFDNISDDELPGSDNVTENDNPLELGLRHYLLKETKKLLRVDAGMSWRDGPELFLRLRLFSLAWQLGQWSVRFSQSLFWKTYKREGFGTSGKIDCDRYLRDDLLFRYTTGTHWSRITDGMEWEESVMLRLDIIPDRCTLLGRTSVFLYDFRGVSNVRADVTLRRQVLTDWMFLLITPRADFPEDNDYEFTPSLRIGIEAVF